MEMENSDKGKKQGTFPRLLIDRITIPRLYWMALEWWKIFYHCEPKRVNVSIGKKTFQTFVTQLKSMSAELQNLCFYFYYVFVFKNTEIWPLCLQKLIWKNFKKTKSRLILLHERLFLKAAAPAFQVKIENPLFHAFAASFSSASCQFCYVVAIFVVKHTVLHTGEHLPSSNYGSILTEVAILWQQRLPLSIFSSVASLHDDRIATGRRLSDQ